MRRPLLHDRTVIDMGYAGMREYDTIDISSFNIPP